MLVVAIYACEGPAGEEGPQGSQGPAGDQGPTGEDGNANVIASDWITPTAYILTEDVFGIDYIEHDLSAPEITQEIINSGVVLVYGKLNGYSAPLWPTDQISLMPIVITYIQNGATQTDTWTAILSPANVKIRFVNSTNLYTTLVKNHSFRYIVIPSSEGSVAKAAGAAYNTIIKELSDAGVNIDNSDEVIAYYSN